MFCVYCGFDKDGYYKLAYPIYDVSDSSILGFKESEVTCCSPKCTAGDILLSPFMLIFNAIITLPCSCFFSVATSC